MSLLNNTAIHDYIVELENDGKDIDKRIRDREHADSLKTLEDMAKRAQANQNSAEVQKYKDLYTKMLGKNNANIREKNQFNADMQLPFKQIFEKRSDLQNIKAGWEQLEDNLTTWIFQQKGARDLAIEFGTALGMNINEIDSMISQRALDAMDNKLPIERGNNLNQSKNVFLNEPTHSGIVSDYETRLSRVKNVLTAKLK